MACDARRPRLIDRALRLRAKQRMGVMPGSLIACSSSSALVFDRVFRFAHCTACIHRRSYSCCALPWSEVARVSERVKNRK